MATERRNRQLGPLVELLNQHRFVIRKRYTEGHLVGYEITAESPVALEPGNADFVIPFEEAARPGLGEASETEPKLA